MDHHQVIDYGCIKVFCCNCLTIVFCLFENIQCLETPTSVKKSIVTTSTQKRKRTQAAGIYGLL
jgi:hypothetical protein